MNDKREIMTRAWLHAGRIDDIQLWIKNREIHIDAIIEATPDSDTQTTIRTALEAKATPVPMCVLDSVEVYLAEHGGRQTIPVYREIRDWLDTHGGRDD